MPACRQEAAEGVLGVDARLDGVPVDVHVVLCERQLLAGGDPQLELDEVERMARDETTIGDRVLHLEPRVHLEEVRLDRESLSSRNSTVPALT